MMAAQEKANVKTMQVGGFQDISEPGKQKFEFWQPDVTGVPTQYVLEFYPLTAEEVEHIRASFPEPEPPTRQREGSAVALKTLQGQGVPITYKDYTDASYQEALTALEQARNMESIRVALRWGPLPAGQKPDDEIVKARDEFRTEMKRRLTAGNFTALLNAVTNASYSLISPELIESFLTSSAPPTPTAVGS